MLPLGGPISELLATLGAVAGGGVAIGSLIAGLTGISRGWSRSDSLEAAGVGALLAGALAVAVLLVEEAVGLR
jgi:hypothetical protein